MSFFNNKGGNSSSPSIPRNDETVETFTSTANQTVFNLAGSYNVGKNRMQVFVGGVRQFSPKNFTETNSKSFTLKEAPSTGTEVIAIYF